MLQKQQANLCIGDVDRQLRNKAYKFDPAHEQKQETMPIHAYNINVNISPLKSHFKLSS
jgi:hypothetical protein